MMYCDTHENSGQHACDWILLNLLRLAAMHMLKSICIPMKCLPGKPRVIIFEIKANGRGNFWYCNSKIWNRNRPRLTLKSGDSLLTGGGVGCGKHYHAWLCAIWWVAVKFLNCTCMIHSSIFMGDFNFTTNELAPSFSVHGIIIKRQHWYLTSVLGTPWSVLLSHTINRSFDVNKF